MLGKAVGHQPTGVEMSKGRPRVGSLVLGNAVGDQPVGIQMSKASASRQFGAWEGCRSPTYRSRNFKG